MLPSVSFGEGGGRGAAMISSGLQRMSPGAQPEQLALRLEPGIAPDAVALGRDVTPSTGQTRPPEVVNVSRARSVPTIIAVVVGLLAFVVLLHALLSSVRAAPARHHGPASAGRRPAVDHPSRPHPSERAGVDRAGDRGTGGIVAGRAAYHAFADRLGLVATPSMPRITVVGSLAIAVLVLANLSAAVPDGRRLVCQPSGASARSMSERAPRPG